MGICEQKVQESLSMGISGPTCAEQDDQTETLIMSLWIDYWKSMFLWKGCNFYCFALPRLCLSSSSISGSGSKDKTLRSLSVTAGIRFSMSLSDSEKELLNIGMSYFINYYNIKFKLGNIWLPAFSWIFLASLCISGSQNIKVNIDITNMYNSKYPLIHLPIINAVLRTMLEIRKAWNK